MSKHQPASNSSPLRPGQLVLVIGCNSASVRSTIVGLTGEVLEYATDLLTFNHDTGEVRPATGYVVMLPRTKGMPLPLRPNRPCNGRWMFKRAHLLPIGEPSLGTMIEKDIEALREKNKT